LTLTHLQVINIPLAKTMPVITLTTDWGRRDHYLAAFRGSLFSLLPQAQVFDITHEVEPFDTLQASYVLQNCFDKFPEETIHFIGLTGAKAKIQSQGYLLVRARNHFFIGYDNGIFYLALGDMEKEIFLLDIPAALPVSQAFESMIKVMSDLAGGKPYNSFGTPVQELVKVFHTQPTVTQSQIRGTVIYIDSFQNVILNITKDLFESVGRNRQFTVYLRNDDYRFNRVHRHYDEAEESELVVLFNEKGNMEIALNRANAAGLLGLKLFDTLRIEFHDGRL
jgi:S-adenosyl-L-methionine hydrolase (adenosine-forming)